VTIRVVQIGLFPLRVGSLSQTIDELEYINKGIYTQGTYDLNDQFSVTAGLRYTWDETTGSQSRRVWRFNYDPLFGNFFAPDPLGMGTSYDAALKSEKQKSSEPTWVLGLDYKPNEDTLLYAKYSRGYRQGSVNVSSQPGFLQHGPEQVDTYEIGTKITFSGDLPGYFNAALFYNDFQDQQLQNGILLSQEFGGVGSTAIVNAGKSEIQGLEIDASVELFEGFIVTASYTFLDTEVKELEDFSAAIAATGASPSALSAVEGDELPFTPENSLVISANYQLPISADLGQLIVGATYVYTDEMRTSDSISNSPLGVLPDYDLLNLNLNWRGVGGSPVDFSLFATNVTKVEYYTYASGSFNTLESETGLPGLPRMYGARIRYNFGN
jgi:iron complex outermembrane receptor protein